MGIEVELRREDGEIIDSVGDPEMVLSRAARKGFSGTQLLKYLLPWGDAVFNQAQASDLSTDIHLVKDANAGTPLAQLLF